MKRMTIVVLILALLCGVWSSAALAAGVKEASPAWIAGLEEAQEAQQLFIVAGVGETTAWVSLHEKDENGAWKQIMTTPGYIGKHGLGKQAEGDGMTPVGTFSFNYAFGIAADPGCAIAYHQVTDDSYWSGDQREGYAYNEMVSIRDLPDLNTDDSEHIVDYSREYQYGLNISYNEEGTPGLGSAIFLHCLGAFKPYTGGCVAIPQEQMITVMQQVRPDCVVVIDSLRNLSPETWETLGLEPQEHAMGLKVSDIFTVEELDAAAALIQAEFETWDGCEMHLLHYAGDGSCNEENLAWLNSLAEGKTFTRCAEFLSDFHTAPDAGGAWNPDAEYSDWQWWLGCTDEGGWELLTWGY
ncbi:MAG: L,D-transpeptidase family protein [Eubacteriales bacterium]|nr:L,D-transpeptidase family protein [Eubacteriales bacterium]